MTGPHLLNEAVARHFANLNLTYFHTTAMEDNLTYTLANIDHSQLLQLDLVVKF